MVKQLKLGEEHMGKPLDNDGVACPGAIHRIRKHEGRAKAPLVT